MNENVKVPVVRSDASAIAQNAKEAVAHGVLGAVFDFLSGHGSEGRTVLGEKPSRHYSSAFLIPANPDELALDDDTSPIRITACGFDFMIRAEAEGSILVRPSFSIYVRVLPTEDELAQKGVDFRLTTEMYRQIRTMIDEHQKQQWEENRDKFGGDRNHEDWLRLRANIVEQVFEQFSVFQILEPDLAEEDGNALEDQFEPRGFRVAPGDSRFPSSDVVSPSRAIEKWSRLPVTCGDFEFPIGNRTSLDGAVQAANERLNTYIREAIDHWLESNDLESGGSNWAYPRGRTFYPAEIADWPNTLEQIRADIRALPLEERRERIALPHLSINWAISVKRDWSDPNRNAVHVAIENRSRLPAVRFRSESDESIFQIELVCRVPAEIHSPMRLDRVESSYRYNRYLNYPALGFNCGIRENHQGADVVLTSDWMPKYCLPKIEPTTHGIDCKFETLASADTCLNAISDVSSALDKWISELDVDVTDGLEDFDSEAIEREQSQFQSDLAGWKIESEMIQRGIDLLALSSAFDSSDPRYAPFHAWLLMNQTMRLVAGGRYDSWRLFQMAFILATLPSPVSRLQEFADQYRADVDDASTLLYFATGGGKSEAFFGLLVFCLFLDRLRGKATGITAMLRYPLRLLTVQQGQRAAKVLAKAELVRRRAGIAGKTFSIGFWVGSTNTPNHHGAPGVADIPFVDDDSNSEESLLRNNPKYVRAVSDWRKLPQCPFCGSSTALRRFKTPNNVLRHGTLGHVCFEASCDWNRVNPTLSPLPFFIVDEDIYSQCPSVILGTIDKLALIGQSPRTILRVFNMFGLAPWLCEQSERVVSPQPHQLDEMPTGTVALSPCYPDGMEVFHDPFPSLLIQDEAHLLEESLGTFAGLFETTLFEVYKQLADLLPTAARTLDGSVRMPKVIAATATVSDPERQVENLYQRKLIRFPQPGPQLYDSFYATPVFAEDNESGGDAETSAAQRRIYATILTNGKPHTTATVAVLSAFHSLITRLFVAFVQGDDSHREAARSILSEAISKTSRCDVYRDAISNCSDSELATLIDLHRIALTYVTNKKGGDQILAAESEQVRKDHDRNFLPLSGFRYQLITGSVDAGLIQQVIEEAEDRVAIGAPFADLGDTLRSIVATSAISHGVDVEELNSMFFAGMPSDIAEYIQASSRVGRTHVGFSLLLPVPQRKRDRYIVETHDIFHRFLERMIQPPAIDRWAEKALMRVVPSFFQTFLAAKHAIPELIGAPPNDKKRVPTYGRVSDVQKLSADSITFRRKITDFVCDAVGLGSNFAPANSQYYREKLEDRIRTLIDDLHDQDMAGLTLMDFFQELAKRSPETLEKPMTSLRDVDVPGFIVPSTSATGQSRRRLSDEQMADLMRILRRGGGGVVDMDRA